ncbi:MAG: GIY-YIG nuclease family protein [Crocinitomicaceae bacterium]|nr:GIY-YIG nuclease family protein [Crocinitomicaceae bacterium]
MATVYIIYSDSIDTFYIGSCISFEARIKEHNLCKYPHAFTRRAKDWKPFLKIDNLDLCLARKIERHLKNMKSRKYLQNLKKYPEISQRLIARYQAEVFR